MNQSNLLQKLAPLGVAAFGAIATTTGSILVAPSAHATLFEIGGAIPCSETSILCEGTLQDFRDSPTIIGDKEFEWVSDSNLPTLPEGGIDNDEVEIRRIGKEYFLFYDFRPDSVVNNFTFEYTVQVTDPDHHIVAVDLDSTVGAFDPVEILTTDFNGVQLVSTQGSSSQLPLPATDFVTVFNEYDSNGGGPIDDFENSFQQRGKVPEPASILGLLTVSGLGLALKYKKQL